MDKKRSQARVCVFRPPDILRTKRETIVIGVDPGTSGAICGIMADSGDVRIYSLAPTKKVELKTRSKKGNLRTRSVMDGDLISSMFKEHGISSKKYNMVAVIEKVHAMGRDGAVQAFSFGASYGFWFGYFAGMGVPIISVTPQKWQKECVKHIDDGKDTKENANRTAKLLYDTLKPALRVKKHQGIADAALIATYGIKKLKSGTAEFETKGFM